MAVTPDGGRVYVANSFSDTVSVIDTRTNTVVDTDPTTDGVNPIPVGDAPTGVAAAPDGSRVYVTNRLDDTVSVINAATNSVVGLPIAVGRDPWGVAVTPDGGRVYVANRASNTVSVIETRTNTVVDTDPTTDGVNPIRVGSRPFGVAVTPYGSRVYVANALSNSVSVIDARTDQVVGDPIQVGDSPIAFGLFIQPKPPFAGTPGAANCAGQSLSAEARRYGGTSAAARALGYGSVQALQEAIRAFCAG